MLKMMTKIVNICTAILHIITSNIYMVFTMSQALLSVSYIYIFIICILNH